ncbi:cop-coated vesicle membrane protein p24 precursor, putative [Leishmania tarentolae]|uniref:Cop-coated vesicle membrane protein p24, putative n=1 Tax=Leishmania tarentolae TaxID=5689 RepID=A0A640KR96_LEITA|nr:cop-coated vesicle membrane protein p24 precursor, putative [Leishmania tarentolae]
MSLRLSKRPRAALGALLTLLVLWGSCAAVHSARADDGSLSVQIPAGQKVCFHEEAPGVGVKMFLHYMVTMGGSMDIDCSILAPDGTVIWDAERETEHRILFKSRVPGSYAFCFSNRMSTVTTKVVSFSVMVGDGNAADVMRPKGTESDTLYRSIMRLQQGLREIEELQQALRIREQYHRATTEVANTRVVVFCILESVFIIAMGVGSIIYLRQMFVTKRMV